MAEQPLVLRVKRAAMDAPSSLVTKRQRVFRLLDSAPTHADSETVVAAAADFPAPPAPDVCRKRRVEDSQDVVEVGESVVNGARKVRCIEAELRVEPVMCNGVLMEIQHVSYVYDVYVLDG